MFGRRKASEMLDSTNDDQSPVEKNKVLDYLVDASPAEFQKLVKVAIVYRKANREADELWGTEEIPSDVNHTAPASASTADDSDLDDLEAAFLTDDEPSPQTATGSGLISAGDNHSIVKPGTVADVAAGRKQVTVEQQ